MVIKGKVSVVMLFLVAILSISLSSAASFNASYTCYQETANASHSSDGSCDLNYAGVYNAITGNWQDVAKVYDGNWATYGYGNDGGGGTPDYLYINYTKPTGALNSSKWMVGDQSSSSVLTTTNISINASCWNYDSSKLVLRVESQPSAMCLNQETLISTPFGEYKIKDLHAGDLIYSYNEKTKNKEIDHVVDISFKNISLADNEYYYIYYSGTIEPIKATYNHKFYSNGNLVMARDLKVGDELLDINNNIRKITKISVVENYEDFVWDLTVEKNHNFYANNILVHNINPESQGVEWTCYNGTTWKRLRYDSFLSAGSWGWVSEEAMVWNISVACGDNMNVTSWGPLVCENATYTLLNNINSTSTCITVSANNVTLNGAGYNITYGNGGVSGYGIYSNSSSYLTIKNTKIFEGNYTGSTKYAISLLASNFSTIYNNTIYTNGSGGHGVYLSSSNFANISSNNISTGNAQGIKLVSGSENASIISNIIQTRELSQTNGAVGISVSSGSYSNIISNNISTVGPTNYGINVICSSPFANISSNYIVTNGSTSYGIYLLSSSCGNQNQSSIVSNYVVTNGSSAAGIIVQSNTGAPHYSMNILSNNISTNGSSAYGIYIYGFKTACSNHIISSNIVSTAGSTAYGIYFFGSGGGSSINNSVNGGIINSTSAERIYLNPSSNNTFRDMTLIGTTLNDTYISGTSGSSINNTFINVTYNSSREYVGSGLQLIRKWYYNAFANYSNGTSIPSGNIYAYNLTNVLEFNTTITNGVMATQTITDYVNTGGTKSYFSLYNISASSTGYATWTHTFNASLENNLTDTFIFDIEAPNATLLTPANATLTKNVTQNMTANITDNMGIKNATLKIYWNNGTLFNSTTITYISNTLTTTVGVVVNFIDGMFKWFYQIFDFGNNANDATVTGNNTITVDATPPLAYGINYTPNTETLLDPNTTLVFNVSINETLAGVDTVRLQFYNGTWTNYSMSRNSGDIFSGNYNASRVLDSTNNNYTFNIWSNDTFGNVNQTINQTFVSNWDCIWDISPRDMGAYQGYYVDKFLSNLLINNTGDVQYANNNCTVTFGLGYEGLSYAYYSKTNWLSSNRGLQYISSISVSAGQKANVSINASFPKVTTPLSENVNITLTADIPNSLNGFINSNHTLNLIASSPGPYLYQQITSLPSIIYLTSQSFIFESYVQNVAGNNSNTNAGYNISVNVSLPSMFDNTYTGNSTLVYDNISNDTKRYNTLNFTWDSSNLGSMSPGVYSINIYSLGYNSSGDIITHANNVTTLSESRDISLLCYSVKDNVCVSACGYIQDPDCPAPTVSEGSSISSSGGGGGGGAPQSVVSSADYQLVRGMQNEVKIVFENKNTNQTLTGLTFSVYGKISKYINISPKNLSSLGPKEKMTLILTITSPTYIELGRQDLTITMKGKLGISDYTDSKKITLEIHEMSLVDANQMINESRDLIKQLDDANLSSNYLNDLFNKSQMEINNFNLEIVRDNYNIIKTQVKYALDSKKIITELDSLIRSAEKKGIDVSKSVRLLDLAKLSMERREFDQAYSRVKDSQITYALEVKGEFGKLSYYLGEYTKEISFGALSLIIFSFGAYNLNRIRVIKNKIRELKGEEKILGELMRVAQNQCFKEKKMGMGEYETSMKEYNKKLSNVINGLIELETQRAQMLTFTSKTSRLKIEKEKIISLIKELQGDYMKKKNVETRTYELKMESFNKRLAEIEERLATLETKKAMKRLGVSMRIPRSE